MNILVLLGMSRVFICDKLETSRLTLVGLVKVKVEEDATGLRRKACSMCFSNQHVSFIWVMFKRGTVVIVMTIAGHNYERKFLKLIIREINKQIIDTQSFTFLHDNAHVT